MTNDIILCEQMFTAIIFDLDGVIIDSEPLQQRAYIDLFSSRGVLLGKDDLLPWLGQREREILLGLSQLHLPSANVEELQKERANRYLKLLGAGVTAMPSATEALKMARLAGFRCALASSSGRREVSLIVQQLEMAKFFEVVITGDDVTRAKPDPDIYNLAVQKLGVPGGECVAIEDSAVGLQSAAAAGISAIVVPNALTANQDFRRAILVADDLLKAVQAVAQSCSTTRRQVWP